MMMMNTLHRETQETTRVLICDARKKDPVVVGTCSIEGTLKIFFIIRG